ncbi:hypothetical protein OTU49_010833, partial [Cherax quadricarinatus]
PGDADLSVTPGDADSPVTLGDAVSPVVPGDAGAPVTPGDAGAPVTPGDADSPVTPGDADSPVTPGDADSPVTPGDAGAPVTPGDADSPVTPGDADSPVTPGDADSPVTPGDADSPVTLGDAVSPVVPGDADSPVTPGDADSPVVPGDADSPVTPGDADSPVTPGDADSPVTPGDADSPVTPGDADSPVTPGDADSPVTPGDADSPVTPGDTVSPVVPGDADSPVTPRDADSPVTPGDADSPVTPGDADSPVTPGDADSPVTPGDADSPVTPRDADSPVTPGDADSPVTPGDADSPVTPGDADSPVTPRDAGLDKWTCNDASLVELSQDDPSPTPPPGKVAPQQIQSPPAAPPPPGILLVGKCKIRETGNATTLARLCHQVEVLGWVGVTLDPDDLTQLTSLQHLVRSHNIVAVVGLHAFRSARILLTCQEVGLPYLVVFGGTDVYECIKEEMKLRVMTQVVLGASHLLAFHDDVRNIILQTWPSLEQDRISIVPQSVVVDPCPDFNVSSFLTTLDDAHEQNIAYNSDVTFELKGKNNQDAREDKIDNNIPFRELNSAKENLTGETTVSSSVQEKLIQNCWTKCGANSPDKHEDLPEKFEPLVVLVAGLRPVKDVLFVVDAWSGWHERRGGCGRFVIVGPALDPHYTDHVHAHIARLSGVRVAPSLAPRKCQALIKSATVLVNSSLSESMPSALLEAMLLGTPVLARDIPGNASVVSHCVTGVLYSSPDTFLQGLDALLCHQHFRHALTAAARVLVTHNHCPQHERDGIFKVLLRVLRQ